MQLADTKNLETSNQDALMDTGDENKYIVFSLGKELYGAKLLEVREVVETMPTKSVPNTVESFVGVCNLRGQIIGVVDLRKRFDILDAQAERSILFVFETDSGAIAATVDKIISVSNISPKDVEFKPNIVSTISSKYILGIAKLNSDLVTLIDLKSILSQDELTKVEQSKILTKAS
jgi:purine-binding chemotaxis protein CheW